MLDQVIKYLTFLKQCLNLDITIKDRVGFLAYADKEVSASLIPYILHKNPYCAYVKSYNVLENKCSALGNNIYGKCKTVNKTFFGVCHAGVGEYVVPLKASTGELFGFITVGCFQTGFRTSEKRRKRLCKIANYDRNQLSDLYLSLRKDIPFDCESVTNAMGVVVEFLGSVYTKCKKDIKSFNKFKYDCSEDFILSRVVSYIGKNYCKQLTVSQLADYCNCSKSHISHSFKRKTGLTIKAYINWLRIEEAKKLLLDEKKTIISIALELGFEDSNYFSKVFSAMTGTSPVMYKKKASAGIENDDNN